MNPYYEQINALGGYTQFKALVQKWNTLSESLKTKPSDAPVILPDIFLVSGSGTGRTHLVRLLAEYLSYDENLMDFYGDVKYFEFLLNYCEPGENFTEIRRLMTEVNNAAGFRNEYKGIVFIDIDEWIEHFKEKHFISFLDYLSDNSDNWLVILSVSDRALHQVNAMESLISAFIRIEKVVVEAPSTEELLTYLKQLLSVYNFVLSEKAEAVLTKALCQLSRNEYFSAYKTVKMLSRDIVYSVYVRGGEHKPILDESDVEEFSEKGVYITGTLRRIEQVRKIGFHEV